MRPRRDPAAAVLLVGETGTGASGAGAGRRDVRAVRVIRVCFTSTTS